MDFDAHRAWLQPELDFKDGNGRGQARRGRPSRNPAQMAIGIISAMHCMIRNRTHILGNVKVEDLDVEISDGRWSGQRLGSAPDGPNAGPVRSPIGVLI